MGATTIVASITGNQVFDDAVCSFNGIIYTPCSKSLKKIKSKKWFDFNLFIMRK